MGNKTGIKKERRGLEEESREYTYGYDAIGRPESVIKDGKSLQCYKYDAFGNRTGLKVKGQETTAYAYNALNQLLLKRDTEGETVYQYDRRGNLTEAVRNEGIRNQYLEKEEEQRKQSYLWDGNAACFYEEGAGTLQYYLQDELGSPIRTGGEDGELAESYGYGKFEGIYTSASNVNTIKSEQYRGSIFKKTTYMDGTENTLS